jgi:hypothetical protein
VGTQRTRGAQIFGPLFADTEMHFEVFRLEDVETVNVLETFAAIHLLTTAEHKTFDAKLVHIFRLFTDGSSGLMTPAEFKCMIECCTLGCVHLSLICGRESMRTKRNRCCIAGSERATCDRLCKIAGMKSFLSSRVSEVSTTLTTSHHR